jgi:hypothetical protein
MKNYILIYHFTDEKDNEFFKKELKKKFPEHKIDHYEELEYFTFPARHQPAVKDDISAITHRLGIGTKDYLALYYTREKRPDEINREMLLGSDNLIETDLKKIAISKHKENLIEFMGYDFLKARKN